MEGQIFELPWEPYPKGRPRFIVRGGFAKTYTPRETRTSEAGLRMMFVTAGAKCYEREVPLAVSIEFRVQRPVSAPKRVFAPFRKPDIENLAKTVLDAGNGIVWADDAQIVRLALEKVFGAPSVRITVQEVQP